MVKVTYSIIAAPALAYDRELETFVYALLHVLVGPNLVTSLVETFPKTISFGRELSEAEAIVFARDIQELFVRLPEGLSQDETLVRRVPFSFYNTWRSVFTSS